MQKSPAVRLFIFAAVILGAGLGLRYGLPLMLPFLLGAGLALAAEPMVGLLCRRLHLPRGAAAGIGVTAVFIGLLAVIFLFCALLVRQMAHLSGILPDLENAARQGMRTLEGWLLELTSRAPGGIRTVLTDSVANMFSGGSALMDQFIAWVLGLASAILGKLSSGVLGLATVILSAFMISGKLPQIRAFFRSRMPNSWRSRYLPALKGLKDALLGYLTAQLKLMSITFVILTIGFFALQIPYAPVWSLLVAVVDAFPVLGTGTVLIPWSVICLLQGQQARGIGLLGIYAVAWLTRSVLEPKLVGKELGLDPLVTLIALYAGYQLWGIAGMLLSPLLAVAAVRAIRLFSQAQ